LPEKYQYPRDVGTLLAYLIGAKISIDRKRKSWCNTVFLLIIILSGLLPSLGNKVEHETAAHACGNI